MTAPAGSVLVVDDEAVNRILLVRILEREGLNAATAVDGQRALAMLQTEPFDVVLLDLLMPGMDGYQVLAAIKQDDSLRDLPVIVISALEDMKSVVRCIEMGADDYLPKPFDALLLRARINAGLARKRLLDLQRDYLEQVGHVVDAAGAVEAGTFRPESLQTVVTRDDALGQLARVFERMAREVVSREQQLRQEVQQLRIEIDQANSARRVAEVTETEFFRNLQQRLDELRIRGDE